MLPTKLLLAGALLAICLSTTLARKHLDDEPKSGELLPQQHRHRHRHEQQQRWPARKSVVDDDYELEDADYSEEYDDASANETEEDYADRRPSRARRIGGSHAHRYLESRHPRHHPRRSSHHRLSRVHGGHHRARYAKRYEDDEEDRPILRRWPVGRYDYDDEEDGGYGHFNKHRPTSSRRRASHSPRTTTSSRLEPRKDWRYKIEDDEDEENDSGYDSDDEDSEEAGEFERPRKQHVRRGRPHRLDSDREKPRRNSSGGDKFDEWLKRIRQENGSKSLQESRKRNRTHEDDADDELEDDEEVDLWKDEENEEELDNDFYKNEQQPARGTSSSLKTFDDIIRKLTMEDTQPAATQVTKRNTELASHLRADAYGNYKLLDSSRGNLNNQQWKNRRADSGAIEDRSAWLRKKSLEDEAGTQADGITDYQDYENDEEEMPTTSTTTSTTPSTTTSTTTTTTTKRPFVNGGGHGYQAARSTGAQYNGYQAKDDYPPMSEYSARKWDYLGTRDSVTATRNNMTQYKLSRSMESKMVMSYSNLVRNEGSCRQPRIKVIPVRELHPNSNVSSYEPHCAMLHRCSDDTGCCRDDSYTCIAKKTQTVELYFYAIHPKEGKTPIEKLSFENHTECECAKRSDVVINDRPPEHRIARHFKAPQNIMKPSKSIVPSCRCPSRFTSRITGDGECECGCVNNMYENDCMKLLVGKAILSVTDRLCIHNRMCKPPNCKFGDFNVGKGSCPMKKDLYQKHQKQNTRFYPPRRS